MTAAWNALQTEVMRWRDAGKLVDFWWRDDDACKPSAAFDRLIGLAQSMQLPLAVAVVAEGLDPEILTAPLASAYVMQHGADHGNRAALGEKKTEFPADEPVEQALARLYSARVAIESAAPGHIVRVLVPPWNRISSAALLAALPAAGYLGLSRFGPRRMRHEVPGLVQVNTHVDIIDWRGRRGFAAEEIVLAQALGHLQAKRLGQADSMEPTGWLTHHAVHDEACWDFLQRLMSTTSSWDAVRWVRPDFSAPTIFYTSDK